MNKSLTVVALSVVLGLTACQQQKADPLAVEPVKLDTEQQKQSYALGSNIGSFVAKQLVDHDELGLPLDKIMIVNGLLAGIQDKSQLHEEAIKAVLTAMSEEIQEKRQVQQEAKAGENKNSGVTYLEENKKREGVLVTDSGLQYEVLTAAEGEKPVATDTVKVHYHGTLIDGTVFDSSVDRGQPAVFPLNRVIAGWTEGVQLMSVGSKFRFHIPSELAYGSRNAGAITPHSTLIFDVELLSIESKGGDK